jgi:SAM-dependent methyltransferase
MRPSATTLLVWSGAPCVYGCPTCPIDPLAARAGVDLAELKRRLIAVPDRDGRLVVITGGEPMLRPDLLRLVTTIRSVGCVPGVVTTGRALTYPHVREKLQRAGVEYLRVQLFGRGTSHDAATAVLGSYEQAIAGVRAWIGDGAAVGDVDVALYARARSTDSLAGEVAQIAGDIGAADVHVVVAGESFEPAAAAAAVTGLARWNDDPGRPLVVWEGLSEPDSPAACTTVPLLGSTFVSAAPAATCLGDVARLSRPSGAVRPRSNSFNFLRTDSVVAYAAAAAECKAHAAARADDRDRQLWLIEGRQTVLYATDTGDFDGAEIARIKDAWSHLFVDRAAAGVLDDFTDGMRRVLPDPVCEACAHRAVCAGRYAVVDAPPFAREEAWIADYVRHLRGRVLDVGCGEQLYRDEIVPLVRSGTVAYTGLDPDQASLDDWRAALPEGRFFQGGIEDFAGVPSSYDRVLCLRSLNHVVDLDEAVARMAALLKPRGQLLIVETTPFAMLRTAAQVAAADRAPRAGHQHFRNVTSEDVLPYARRRGLKVVHHHPVGLATTNEWILLLEK